MDIFNPVDIFRRWFKCLTLELCQARLYHAIFAEGLGLGDNSFTFLMIFLE